MKRLAVRHEVHFLVFPPFRVLREPTTNTGGRDTSDVPEANAVFSYEGIYGHRIEVSPFVRRLWQRSMIIAYIVTAVSVFLKSSGIFQVHGR